MIGITQSKCTVRKLKSKCPLLSRHIYGLEDQHRVPNIPCDRADQDIFLFHHLTYFHKLNAKAATKLIRALIMNKGPLEPVFHSNDIIIVSDQIGNNQQKSNKKNYSENMVDFSTHYQSLLNAINTSNHSTTRTRNSNDKFDNSMMPLDCSKWKQQQSCQISSPYTTTDMAHAHDLDLDSFLT